MSVSGGTAGLTSFTVESSGAAYPVVSFPDLSAAIAHAYAPGTHCLIDERVLSLYNGEVRALIHADRLYPIVANETVKSFEALTPVFTALLERGIKRDGAILVVGGGVLQDIGCFVASVLFRGVPWRLVPTTLLAQCDSCIGSKSSINIGPFKNQIGTFYPPREVALTHNVLGTLSWDDVRSGVGEMLKLHLLTSDADYRELLLLLEQLPGETAGLGDRIVRSLRIKQRYIEQDEFDRGIRNLLNYGHTFGHAYESATHYAIPHGIAVTLGMLSATFVSARLGLVSVEYFRTLASELRRWYTPFERELLRVELSAIARALRTDKKSTAKGINCILTRGAGAMERHLVPLEEVLFPAVSDFIAQLASPAISAL